MTVRPVEPRDRQNWLRMRSALWPDEDGLEAGIEAYFGTPDPAVVTLIAFDDEQALGFAEVGPRAYAEGCETSPVAFLEGWYVEPEAQRKGVGRALIAAAEAWARDQGFKEFGSDTWLHNAAGIEAHRALGFEETERLVCFLKRL
jgi:aminoglycoside 6'-N-acetyltransferase I